MELKIKTLNGIRQVDHPPNGGWAWVLVFAAFNNLGLGFGIPKTMGIFFNEIKEEFGTSNTAVSWLITTIISFMTFSGVLAQVLTKWIDERQIVIIGGLLSSVGMVTCSFSPNIFVMYFGGIITGVGCGMLSLIWFSQLALYFSTNTAIANAIALSGSTLYGVAVPYLSQYLMDRYTWRGALFILGGICLNACVCGALLHPITLNKDQDKNKELSYSRQSIAPEKQCSVLSKFMSQYWLCLCFLFVNIVDSASMYLPNVYIIPYSLALDFSENQSVVLLSAISIGDFVGRLFSGVAITKFAFLHDHLLTQLCTCFWVMCLVQLIPALSGDFGALTLYCLTYGLAFGIICTVTFTAIAKYIPKKIVARGVSWFFASAGIGMLISGAMAGRVVDLIGNIVSVFWLIMIVMGFVAASCTTFSALTVCRFGDKVVFDQQKPI